MGPTSSILILGSGKPFLYKVVQAGGLDVEEEGCVGEMHLHPKLLPCSMAMGTYMQSIDPIINGIMGISVYNSQFMGILHMIWDFRNDLGECEILMLWLWGMMGVLMG
jgi:hypothetical protein